MHPLSVIETWRLKARALDALSRQKEAIYALKRALAESRELEYQFMVEKVLDDMQRAEAGAGQGAAAAGRAETSVEASRAIFDVVCGRGPDGESHAPDVLEQNLVFGTNTAGITALQSENGNPLEGGESTYKMLQL